MLYRIFPNNYTSAVSRDSPILHIIIKKQRWILPMRCRPTSRSRGIEVQEAWSAPVDPPVDPAVYGLCQSDIKDIRLRAEDSVVAVKHSIPSLSLLLTPLSATQQAYWLGQHHSYNMQLSSPMASVWTWVLFKAKSCKLAIVVILTRNPHAAVITHLYRASISNMNSREY